MASPPSVNVARLTYLLVCEAAGVAIALSTKGTMFEVPLSIGIIGGLGVAALFIWVESLMKGFTLRGFSTATFGLGVGLFCAWLLTRVEISNLLEIAFRDQLESEENSEVLVNALRLAVDVTLFASLGFLGAMLSLRGNRDDFAFIIPYVRFRQDASSGQPVVLDPDAVIDGRVPGILRSGFLHGRLIETARLLGARLMTADENLAKVAKLQGLDVLNIHELDDALKPTVAVGQRLRIALVRTGKEDHQGVGYMPDGTMIVVNHAVAKIGNTVDAVVVSTLQTAGGTMVFAELHNAG